MKLIKIDGVWVKPDAVKKVERDTKTTAYIDMGGTAAVVTGTADEVAEVINEALEGPKYVLDFESTPDPWAEPS